MPWPRSSLVRLLVSGWPLVAGLFGCGSDEGNAPWSPTTPSAQGGTGGAGCFDTSDCYSIESCKNYSTEQCGFRGAQPPLPPQGAGPGDGQGEVLFAVSKLHLGDMTRDGADDSNAWKELGFDLDGYSSTATFPMHCKLHPGGKKKDIAVDGAGGLDNSFGKNIIGSLFSGLSAHPTNEANITLRKGAIGWLLRVDALGSRTSYLPLHATWQPARSPLPGDPPAVEPGRPWSPLTSSEPVAMSGYLADNTLVLRAPRLRVDLLFDGPDALGGWPIEIHQALLGVQLSEDHGSGQKGTLAGVLPVEPHIELARAFAPHISTSFCDEGSAFEGIAQQIRQAADSLVEGGQDPGKTCDAISIGLGFELVSAQPGEPVPPPDEVDPCAAAGAAGTSGAGGGP